MRRSVWQTLWRAIRLRCPNCGQSGLFRTWLTMRSFCPACGLVLERESGYYTGAIAINLVAGEASVIAIMIGWMILSWPQVPWTTIQIVTIVGAVLVPILFWPFSKTIWLAISLLAQPAGTKELIPDYRFPRDQGEPPGSNQPPSRPVG